MVLTEDEIIRMRTLGRFMNQTWLKGKKADLWICGNSNPSGESTKIQCEECGKDCFATFKENEDLKKRKCKKICVNCAITKEKYNKEIPKEQLAFLKR